MTMQTDPSISIVSPPHRVLEAGEVLEPSSRESSVSRATPGTRGAGGGHGVPLARDGSSVRSLREHQ